MMIVNLSLASYPRMGFIEAMRASDGVVNTPVLGRLARQHVQICPQNRGVFDVDVANDLMTAYPATKFRLHANVRVSPVRRILDWVDYRLYDDYWSALVAMSGVIKAPAYTAHAGLREHGSLADVFGFAEEAEQRFGIPVGVEHHYPTSDDRFLLSSWGEMEALLNSGVGYVIDLSHIHILAKQTREKNITLLKELLSSDKCIEVHLSWNNGIHDQHLPLPSNDNIWWWSLLSSVNDNAVTFFEGNLLK